MQKIFEMKLCVTYCQMILPPQVWAHLEGETVKQDFHNEMNKTLGHGTKKNEAAWIAMMLHVP